jgi:hypothetical protein
MRLHRRSPTANRPPDAPALLGGKEALILWGAVANAIVGSLLLLLLVVR